MSEGLTEREREILLKAAEGLTDKEIASELGLAVDTILSHWKRARKKVGASSRTEAVAMLLRAFAEESLQAARAENERLLFEVAERTRAEVALEASDAKLRLLLAQIPASLWTTDREFVITSVVGAGLPHLGEPSQFLGASLPDMADRGLVSPALRPALEAALAGKETAYSASTSGVSYQVRVSPLRNLAGVIEGCLGLAVNTTEQAEAEAKLLQSEADFRALVDQAFEGIYITDADGRYLYVNPSGCELLGYTLEELHQTHISEVVDPEDLRENPSRVELLQAGEDLMVTRRLRRKTGELIVVDLSARRLADGKLLGVTRLRGDRPK